MTLKRWRLVMLAWSLLALAAYVADLFVIDKVWEAVLLLPLPIGGMVAPQLLYREIVKWRKPDVREAP